MSAMQQKTLLRRVLRERIDEMVTETERQNAKGGWRRCYVYLKLRRLGV